MFRKHFQRRKENFICEVCGFFVEGDGYTNHCPNCLYSKHVDINPGDRASTCGGLMEPIDVIQKKGHYYIVHKCLKCGFVRNAKFREEKDNFEKLLEIIKNKKI